MRAWNRARLLLGLLGAAARRLGAARSTGEGAPRRRRQIRRNGIRRQLLRARCDAKVRSAEPRSPRDSEDIGSCGSARRPLVQVAQPPSLSWVFDPSLRPPSSSLLSPACRVTMPITRYDSVIVLARDPLCLPSHGLSRSSPEPSICSRGRLLSPALGLAADLAQPGSHPLLGTQKSL